MRSFLLALVLLCACSHGQQQASLLGIIKESSSNNNTNPYIGTYISDNFSGTSLSGWTANGSQSLNVSNNVRVTGTTNTRDFTKSIIRTGYGKSTMRNYTVSAFFKLNTTAGYGVFCGVESQRNSGIGDVSADTYAVLNYTGSLQVAGGTAARAWDTAAATISTGLPSINTTDNYKLVLDVNEDVATATIYNLTAGTSKSVSFTYIFNTPSVGDLLRPNIFYYSFGVMGAADVTFTNVNVSSSEKQTANYCFVGNSITTGYQSGSATNSFAYKLRSYTTNTIQVMAGGGNTSQDVLDNIQEIIARNPAYVFLEIGTNDIGRGIALSTIQSNVNSIISQLQSAGIYVYTLSAVNGGSVTTPGTYNYWLANNTHFINDLATYSGNTVDGVHPTNQGMQIKADYIRGALPNLFPL